MCMDMALGMNQRFMFLASPCGLWHDTLHSTECTLPQQTLVLRSNEIRNLNVGTYPHRWSIAANLLQNRGLCRVNELAGGIAAW